VVCDRAMIDNGACHISVAGCEVGHSQVDLRISWECICTLELCVEPAKSRLFKDASICIHNV
jgi:hypothetical protein